MIQVIITISQVVIFAYVMIYIFSFLSGKLFKSVESSTTIKFSYLVGLSFIGVLPILKVSVESLSQTVEIVQQIEKNSLMNSLLHYVAIYFGLYVSWGLTLFLLSYVVVFLALKTVLYKVEDKDFVMIQFYLLPIVFIVLNFSCIKYFEKLLSFYLPQVGVPIFH